MVWIDRAADRADLAAIWPWSSLAAHCGEAPPGSARPPLLSAPDAYWQLGNTPFAREAAYRERLAHGVAPSQSQALEAALRSGLAVGDTAFLTELERKDFFCIDLETTDTRPRFADPVGVEGGGVHGVPVSGH